MPASSIDTFLACSIMIVLVLSAMVSTSNTLRPSMNELLHRNYDERFQQLAQYLLLNKGAPANWGSLPNVVPESLGLADSASSLLYQLDIDKVSRLNSHNIYSLTYSQLWQSLGVSDVSFRIWIKPLFNLSTTLISTTVESTRQITNLMSTLKNLERLFLRICTVMLLLEIMLAALRRLHLPMGTLQF